MESVDSRDEEAPLVADSLQVLTPKNYTRDVHILSCAFLLIFLAYGAAQNLETTVNTVEQLPLPPGPGRFPVFELTIDFLFVAGGEFGNDFAWDIVHVVHVFLFSCFIGGSSVGFQERSDPWDYWVLVIRGCQFVPFVVLCTDLTSVFQFRIWI